MAMDYNDEPHTPAESARDRAEHLRRAAEQGRDVAEAHRQREETRRDVGERGREAAETARTLAEGERAEAETIRNDAMMTLETTAESLHMALEHMKAVEETRRALRDIPGASARDTN